MSSHPEKQFFVPRAIQEAQAQNEKTLRRIGELIGSSSGMVIKGKIPDYGGGLLSHMSDEAREALEAQMKKSAETLSAQLPQIAENAFKFELPERIHDSFSGAGAIQLGLEGVGQHTQRDLFEALDETAVPAEPAAQPASRRRRKARRASTPEQIATRVIKRHRQVALSLLKLRRFSLELKELKAVEAGLRKGTKRSCKHASFNARNLMEGLADHLFPATSEKRGSRIKEEHSLGPNDFKNRLIAYVEERLRGKMEAHDFRSFISAMDSVFRWTGSGPHGAYGREEAEHVYPRLLEALAVIARAHAGT